MGSVVSAIGNAVVSVGETVVNTAVDVVETTVQVVQDPSKIVDIVTPANIANLIMAPIAPGLTLLDAAGIDPFDELGIPNPIDLATDVIEMGINVGVDFVQDPGGTIEDAFSKDGYFTRFVEENVPGGGYVTAIAHAAAGNDDHAVAALLKGGATGMETLLTVGGGLVGGPAGAAAGGALGAGARNLFEGAMHDLVPDEMQDRFRETDFASLATDMAFGAAFGVTGVQTSSRLTKAAAKEGINEVSEDVIKNAIARDLLKQTFTTTLAGDAGLDLVKATFQQDQPEPSPTEVLELVTQQRFEDRMATQHAQAGGYESGSPTFDAYYDENLGAFWMRDGVVVWDEAEATALEMRTRVEEKGFETIAEYRDEMTNSYKLAAQYEAEAGTPMAEFVVRDNEILGDFVVHDGEILWGASSEEEAKSVLADNLAVERGYDNADAFRQNVVDSWRMSHEYDVENGSASGEAIFRSDDVLGDYVIKEGRVVFGATTEEEAAPLLRDQMAQENGYESAEAYQAELAESYRQVHDFEAEFGGSDGGFVLRDNPVSGPFMVVNGEVVWGVTTEEEAERIVAERFTDAFDPDAFDPDAEFETGGGYIVDEPDDPGAVPFESLIDIEEAPEADTPDPDTEPTTTDGSDAASEPAAADLESETIAALLEELRAVRSELAELRAEVEDLDDERTADDDDTTDDAAAGGDDVDPALIDIVEDPESSDDDDDDWDELPSEASTEAATDTPVIDEDLVEYAPDESGETPMNPALITIEDDPLGMDMPDAAEGFPDPTYVEETTAPDDVFTPAVMPEDQNDPAWGTTPSEEYVAEANEEDLAFAAGEQVEDYGTIDFGAESGDMHDDNDL